MARFRADQKLGREAPVPIYYRLQMELMAGIENGRWAPGEAIPPERRIAADYRVSPGTVKRALANLVGDGYLFRVQGKGTFVSGTTIPKESVRYTRLRREFNGSDPAFRIRSESLKKIPGRQPINSYLKIRMTQELWEFRRVFVNKTGPLAYNVSYLPVKMLPDLDKLPKSKLEKSTLYELIENRYGFPSVTSQELFGAEVADRELAEILGIETGHPVLRIEMRAFTYKDRPIEYRLSYCATDKRMMFREM